MPEQGLSAVPKNFFLNSMKELRQKHPTVETSEDVASKLRKDNEERKCHNGKRGKTPHGKATVFCLDCGQFYCESCEASHTVFEAFCNHQLKPVGEVDGKSIAAAEQQARIPRCEQHPTQQVDLYCDMCHMPICTTCCILTHRQHEVRALLTLGGECQDRLTELNQAAVEQINKLGHHLEQLRASESDIQRDIKKACQEVDQAADEMIASVDKRRQYLIQKIRRIEKIALEEARSACKETALYKDSAESLQSHVQALQASGNITEQLVHTPDLQQQLHQQKMLPLPTVTWTARFEKETKSVDALDAMLGTVSAERSVVTTSELPLPTVAAKDMEKIQLGQPIDTLKLPSSLPGYDACVTLDNCVCAAAGKQLYACNTATQKGNQVQLTDVKVTGMTVIKSNTGSTLVIADQHKKLHFVKVDQVTLGITTVGVKDLDFEPRHLSVHPVTGQLVIADYTNKAIVICDAKGNLHQRVTVQTAVNTMKCVVAADDGYIILDDWSPGRIHWVDSQGRVTSTYGTGEGERLSRPDHMLRDSQGWLVVPDWGNHRLHLVDAHGQLSCYLLTGKDDIRYPRCVWLEETTSQLYVMQENFQEGREIRVYKWPTSWPARPTPITTTSTHHTLHMKLVTCS